MAILYVPVSLVIWIYSIFIANSGAKFFGMWNPFDRGKKGTKWILCVITFVWKYFRHWVFEIKTPHHTRAHTVLKFSSFVVLINKSRLSFNEMNNINIARVLAEAKIRIFFHSSKTFKQKYWEWNLKKCIFSRFVFETIFGQNLINSS